MTQGFSGGFFLPAQRSIHCKGGFFSSTTNGSTKSSAAASAPFPVLFTVPQAPPATDVVPNANPKARTRRVYDPHEGEEEYELVSEEYSRIVEERTTEASLKRSTATTRPRVGHRPKQHEPTTSQASSSRSNSTSREVPMRSRERGNRGHPQEMPTTEKGDINSKFEIAMKELNEIKDAVDLKQQRQHSAPVLPINNSMAIASSTSNRPVTKSLISTARATSELPQQPQDASVEEKLPPCNMESPRQRLQVAEMVMRKLYKKNLQTEQALATAKAENEQLTKKLTEIEARKSSDRCVPLTSSTQVPSTPASSVCTRCLVDKTIGVGLTNPPSMDTISRIDQQQLEYLRHLAAEQDRTISSLKLRIEELSAQLTTTKQGVSNTTTTKTIPRQVKTKLQLKLKDALIESERQKTNYLKLKRDFQHLLALKTKTLYNDPTQLNTSAKELVALMDKQLKQLEAEHTMNLSLYNSKLYETEQQSCESYAQQRLLEEEMARVARDVQQRDALDVEIEQCMANVFERLHHVESENVQLKTVMLRSSHELSTS